MTVFRTTRMSTTRQRVAMVDSLGLRALAASLTCASCLYVRALLLVFGTAICTAGAEELQLEHVGLKLMQQSEVPAQESGPLLEILVREGQRVTAGTLLARIDDQDALIDVARAQLNRDNADELARSDVQLRGSQQLLKLAEMDWQRADDQQRRFPDTVSAAELDRLRVTLERAKLDVEQAEQQRSTARRALRAADNELRAAERGVARRKIVAPIDGVVVAINFRLGEWVEPGDKLLRLVDSSRLRAEGFVVSEQLPDDLFGRPVTFAVETADGKAPAFAGQVVFVSPEANPVSRQVRVWAEIANQHGRLRPGLTGRLIIQDHVVNSSSRATKVGGTGPVSRPEPSANAELER